MRPTAPLPAGAERVRAFELIHALQSGDAGAAAALAAMTTRAELEGRDELVRIGLLGRAVGSWLGRLPGHAADVAALAARAEHDGDDVMVAVALAMRSNLPDDPADPGASAERDADLARAAVLLETATGGDLELLTARTACGIGFGYRGLWELCEEQYDLALRVDDGGGGRAREGLRAAVAFNLAENDVAWAAELRQKGDHAGVVARWHAWRVVSSAAREHPLPPAWQLELIALGQLLAALAGEDVRAPVEELLAASPRSGAATAHLHLAAAVGAIEAGASVAAVLAERAVTAIDADLFPHMYDLAVHLCAELEAAAGHPAGLRAARRQLDHNQAHRLSRLGAMRARIEAERLRAEHARLTEEATRDPLTGLANRRGLEAHLGRLRNRRTARVAILMVDVDDFKAVNDRHGHDCGDAALCALARILDRNVRPADLAVRLGGDEFLVVVADASEDVALQRAASILFLVDDHHWEEVAPGLRVTVSVGVAAGPLAALDEVRRQADRAVYQAKAGGGDTVCSADWPLATA